MSPYNGNIQIKHDVTHHIETKDLSVHAEPQRLAPEWAEIIKKEFQHMSEHWIFRPLSSKWASPFHMVPKKTAGDWLPCRDYHALNNATIPNRHHIPHIQDFRATLHGATIFSKLGLVRAYHQIPVQPSDVPKIAVKTPFGFAQILFGLRNVAQTLQHSLDQLLHWLTFDYDYIDDRLVTSEDSKEHKSYLQMILERLQDHEILVNPSKCKSGVPQLQLLDIKLTVRAYAYCRTKFWQSRSFPNQQHHVHVS